MESKMDENLEMEWKISNGMEKILRMKDGKTSSIPSHALVTGKSNATTV